ncbi:adenine phosphoribosyltransferase [Myxococcaceae bacterium]|jgi:adenine phosphoribosyltransferase|nr:adenine phosphoribosyltransferase [Myxococcaceae bacterium]
MRHSAEDLRRLIRDVPDFPKPGILFRDVTPLLADPAGLRGAVEAMADPFRDAGVDRVLGIESRGFLLGAPVALALGAGLVIVRKPGKLPWRTMSASYELEYGHDTVEMHEDALAPGQRVLVVDDLIATGGTARAAVQLARESRAEIVGASFLVELVALGGRERLDVADVRAVIEY